MPKRILVVDHQPQIAEFMCRYLEQASYIACTVNSGQEALDYLATTPACDLLIIGDFLPDIDGFELLKRVQSGSFRTIPVIYLYIPTNTVREDDPLQNTFNATSPTAATYRLLPQIGLSAIFQKPFNPNELVKTVQRLLSEPNQTKLTDE